MSSKALAMVKGTSLAWNERIVTGTSFFLELSGEALTEEPDSAKCDAPNEPRWNTREYSNANLPQVARAKEASRPRGRNVSAARVRGGGARVRPCQGRKSRSREPFNYNGTATPVKKKEIALS